MKDRAAGRRFRHVHAPDIVDIIRNLGPVWARAFDRSMLAAAFPPIPPAAPLGTSRHDGGMRGGSASLEIIDEVWHDPTHGTIDREIQEAVDRNFPGIGIGRRVAIERTAQDRKDRGLTW